jgi:hypothetical protein
MPIRRSLVSTMPAIDIERQLKNAEPSTTSTATPRILSGFAVMPTPRMAAKIITTMAWISALVPDAKALPVIRAARGVGVTRSLVRTPASRSQMIMMP